MRKTNPAPERLAALRELADLVEIILIGRSVIEAALTLGCVDFEDGLQCCAARGVPAIEAIVTRVFSRGAAGSYAIGSAGAVGRLIFFGSGRGLLVSNPGSR